MTTLNFEAMNEQTKTQYACIFGMLLLHDAKADITSDKLLELTKAAGVTVPAYWPQLFLKATEGQDLAELLAGFAAGGAGGNAGAAGGAGQEVAAGDEEKEASEDDADVSMPDLFGDSDSDSD